MRWSRSGASVDVVCLGEALIDFVSLRSGIDLMRARGFKKAAGGAPANVAVGICRLGARAGFVGKVGRDPFGEFLQGELHSNGVDVTGMHFDQATRTTLAFVSLTEKGERDFIFYRNPGADMLLRPEEVEETLVSSAPIFHFGSVSLSREPARSATKRAIEIARHYGRFVSFDVNFRPGLWSSEAEAQEVIFDVLPMVNLTKVNDDELTVLAGRLPIGDACRLLRSFGPQMVLVTLGPDGCFYQRAQDEGSSPGFQVRVVDTTGAGDAFTAAILAGLARGGPWAMLGVGQDNILALLREANAAGALATTLRGAIPALPNRRRIHRFLKHARFAAQRGGGV